MGLLNFNNVTKYFGQRLLLDDISFSVERGERLAMIGPNGSGKTTLLRIAMGEESADMGSATLARGTKAGFLTQDLSTLEDDKSALDWSEYAHLEARIREIEARMTTADAAALDEMLRTYEKLTTRFEAMDGYTIQSHLKATLLGLGLREEALGTPLHLLSSGERMRVALARILLKSPDLLVLDEPTNHLDIAAVMWLEKYLLTFSGGVLVISHDRYFLDRVATRMIELRNTSIVQHHGNYSSFLRQQDIRSEFLRSERERLDREIKDEAELARKLRASAHITQAKSREKRLERLKTERQGIFDRQKTGHLKPITAPGLNLKAEKHQSAEIAIAENAGMRYGERVLFEHVNFLVRGGERAAIVGPNGCGKTTLLRILLGKEQGHTGVLTIGHWVKVGVLDQNAEFEDERRTMLEELIRAKEQTEPEAKRVLAKVGFYGDETAKTIDKLSGGERVRLKLALLLQQSPQCLVLDEPTNHLDLPAREAVEQAIAQFGGTVLAVSHDRYFLNHCAGRILAFEGTRIRSYEGNWDDYQNALERARNQNAPAAEKHGRRAAKPMMAVEAKAQPTRSAAQIEAQIALLEAKKQFVEQLIGPDTKPETYDDYALILSELEALYKEWDEQAEGEAQ